MDWKTNMPVYQQIEEIIKNSILGGQFKEGELLPSIRNLAPELEVNPLTIQRVYRSLVNEGWVVAERGVGMRVVTNAKHLLLQQEKQNFLEKEWPAILEKIERFHLNSCDLFQK